MANCPNSNERLFGGAVVLEVAEDKTKIKADISNFGTTTTIELEAGSFEPLP